MFIGYMHIVHFLLHAFSIADTIDSRSYGHYVKAIYKVVNNRYIYK